MQHPFSGPARRLSLLSVLLLLTLASCTRGGGKVASVSPKEVEGLLRNDFAVLVDVREEDEVKGGMAAPAQWFATSKIQADDPAWKDFLAKHPKEKQLVLYCAVGGRAGKIAAKLAEQGYKVGNMGGFRDWKAAGLPVRTP
jgi:rhodanese-related sulfurtransferase